ncbi:MAG: protein kinase, partial [Planctomycetes bacterium]|nr:protein kinase [Planctomycetota bacterium]
MTETDDRSSDQPTEAGDDQTLRLPLSPTSAFELTSALTPSEADSDRAEGDFRLGRFRILRELGRGGMGVVYLAEESSLGRQVALKILPAGFATTPQARARFRREAETASRLDHPNLCGVLATGEDEGLAWISMRYLPGQSLRQVLDHRRESGGVTWVGSATTPDAGATTRRILEQIETVARAVHRAHEAGIIHRDLKPGNIMITPDGEPVVLDFGLAQDLHADASLTMSGDLLGTPYYMAPEQISAAAARCDERTDVWALGVILYECLTLKRPFEAATRDALYRAILDQDPPPLRRSCPAATRDLETIVATALEKDPGRRYGSALALAEDLRAYLDIRPLRARPLGLFGRVTKFARRRKAVAALILILAAGLPTGALLWWRGSRDALRLEESIAREVAAVEDALTDRSPVTAARALDDLRRLRAGHPDIPSLAARIGWMNAMQDAATMAMDLDDDPAGTRALAALDLLQDQQPFAVEPRLWKALILVRSHQDAEARSVLASGGPAAAGLLEVLADPDSTPRDARAKLFAALLVGERGRPAQALVQLEALLEASPGDHDLAWAAAEQAGRIQDYHAALALAGRARSLAGAFSPARLGRYADHLFRAGHADMALATARQALAQSPANPLLQLKVANALAESGQTTESREALEALVADHPDLGPAWRSLSALHFELGDLPAALEAARNAVTYEHQSPEALLMLGNVQLELRQDQAACATLQSAVSKRPDFVFALNSLASALRNLGRNDEARDVAEELVVLRPTYAGAWFTLGSILLQSGDESGAERAFLRCEKHGPLMAQPSSALGVLYLKQGRSEEARERLERATALDPQDAPSFANLSVLYGERDEWDKALELAHEAVRLAPRDLVCLRNLISAQLQTKRFEEAFATTWDAHTVDPSSPEVLTSMVAMGSLYDPRAAVAAGMLLE